MIQPDRESQFRWARSLLTEARGRFASTGLADVTTRRQISFALRRADELGFRDRLDTSGLPMLEAR